VKAIVVGTVLVFAQMKTTQDGIYAVAQAKRGQTLYAQTCASCHAPDLSGGGQASSLTGSDFNAAWNDMPLRDLFERIRATMPADAPGTLKPAEVADILAFLLQKAAFPAGDADLPADASKLEGMKFVAPKP
jgi:alcohol dehydrogenase (cytochrome c)